MAYLLGFAICVALFLSTLSLYRYGNIQRQHPLVTLSVLTAWTFSFLIVFTIPLDVTSVSSVAYTFCNRIESFEKSSFVACRRFIDSAFRNTMRMVQIMYRRRLMLKNMNANSHGEWYQNMYFPIYGE